MNAYQRRQFEMLLRVRDFGTAHGQLFSAAGGGPQALAAVSAGVDALAATALTKAAASVSARAERKVAARKALADLLVRVNQLAKVYRARGNPMPPFDLPRSRSDQALLIAGRQFAKDAATFEAEFSGHGMGPALIADATAAFEAVVRDRGMSRADHTAARTRIQDLITTALQDVRRVELVLGNELSGDNVIQAVWKQARRIEDPRRPRINDAAPQPVAATPEVAPVTEAA